MKKITETYSYLDGKSKYQIFTNIFLYINTDSSLVGYPEQVPKRNNNK